MTNPQGSGLTGIGKLFSVLLVIGLVALGGWIVLKRMNPSPATQTAGGGAGGGGGGQVTPVAGKGKLDPADLAETKTKVPTLAAAMAYVPAKPEVIEIELSKYAGYAGLIAANGGLAPNPDSVFAKKYGFQLNIKLSEEESWSTLNSGKMAASATTVDVLSIYGRQFQVVVPAQIGYSRGADALVVRSDIKKVNDLKGKIVAASQFTEADFFIRYLAQEAGIEVAMLDPASSPDPDKINLVFVDEPTEGGAIAKLMLKDIAAGGNTIAGVVTSAPFTSKIVDESGGKATILVSNKNLLIIADILIVNRGFAEKNPDKVAGLVDGLLAGNKAVRENPEANADAVGKALGWDRAKTLAELKKVHLSNLPENQAFFSGGITAGGSFASIYQSAFLAYGAELIPNPVSSDRFVQPDALKKAEASGAYKDQVAAIQPISSGMAAAEVDPVLSKDIRFFFEPNSDKLDMAQQANMDNLKSIKRILDVSPGSKISLVGHVDNSKIPEFRAAGGEARVRQEGLGALDLSKRRAQEVMNQLVTREKVDPKRLETSGMGWTKPVSSTNSDLNRRVEVQWYTLE